MGFGFLDNAIMIIAVSMVYQDTFITVAAWFLKNFNNEKTPKGRVFIKEQIT